MIAGDAPLGSVPVSDALHVTPAAGGVFIPMIGQGAMPGMALVGPGGLTS